MQGKENKFNRVQKIGIAMAFFSFILLISTPKQAEAANLGGPSHIGTFEGSTTFTTGSSNGVNPGLYLEVMDRYGNYKEYTSEDGVITVDDTKEGAYVTQAKLLGKTKYRDVHTGELLDQWEAGRDLRLESSKMPVLKTVGKNLLDESKLVDEHETHNYLWTRDYTIKPESTTKLKPNTTYVLSFSEFYGDGAVILWNGETKTRNVIIMEEIKKAFFTTTSEEDGISFYAKVSNSKDTSLSKIQLEEGSVATSYEPYKTNILTTSEEVELRGIGEVKDELDLMTGEVVKRIGEIVLDGSENWQYANNTDGTIRFPLPISNFKDYGTNSNGKNLINNKLPEITFSTYGNRYGVSTWCNYVVFFTEHTNVNDFKQWLSQNPTTVQYELATESVKTVVLTSDYYFQPVMNRDVHIDGTILPLVCSVTIPTEHLSFVLNPNEEKGKQFVAPDFSITNNTPASIYLELNTFEQLANDLNDVLPTEHENWNTLDRKQSKDIALALVPKPSDGWLSLTEGPRYVADSSNYYLGEVKAESSVDFTFEANHGRAFLETLSPRYRLSFIFDFFDK